ncbi:MAG: aminotransferase class I/II-fold pyridoxal phosphate-dependent enzyme, partial [Candidatus Aminicenantes bacterium]|nr:aminotransferase class I/II-fold pyridoxal phosphate-dependent enzyme [Candidatus Aminicenantes bacterium]
EVYLDFMTPPKNESSIHRANNVIAISSLTKVYGLGGLRCGWIIAPPALAAGLRRIIDHINVEGVFVGDLISDAVWDRLEIFRTNHLETVRLNHQIVRDWIESEPGLSWQEPDGGVVCFPRIETGLSGRELADTLRQEYDTGIVPGHFFGRDKHFRLGFGGSTDILKQALSHIHSAL